MPSRRRRAPRGGAPSGQAPSGQAPSGQAPSGQVPSPSGDAPRGIVPGAGTPRRGAAAPTRIPAAVPVSPATPGDLSYVVHLQKRHAGALGFIPRVALREKIDLGRVWLARENGQPAGFLHHGSLARPEVRIFQAAIQYDARRRHMGLALVNDLVRRAAGAGAAGVSLRCLSFLDANEFWRAAGFRLLATEPGAKGTLNVWVKRLREGAGAGGLEFHSRVHPCPGCDEPTVDTWVRGARRLTFCPACVAAAGRN